MPAVARTIHAVGAIAFALLLAFTLIDQTSVRSLTPNDTLLIVAAVALLGLNVAVRYTVASDREYRADQSEPSAKDQQISDQ